ncbi:ABC-type Fe3+-siderophore transport system, ATPase component [Leucobacter sp. 7(1)]|uniref:ABC transporter ATP-binding protein n=1 Tax=Leucobacter sp. 7(1) TaxID=1255613 RepID=UPI00097E9E93|nr:ABC transporter ATP-binding protein [Leucobacter sp. 7(1)]SJN13428.1 ABC-type Fe3+-siderophore transport system, ATPase component [Leucobacter sp. 7(1)]
MTTDTPTPAPAARLAAPRSLRAEHLSVRYGERPVLTDLSLEIPTGGFTVIIGPNGCGKSTLLRSLARLLRPRSGTVTLDGHDLAGFRTKAAARQIGTLAQAATVPAAVTVADLVARGRNPHQSLLRQWNVADERAVAGALAEVGMTEHADRLIEELSGGQRQRAWIAMTLAQETPILLLDEPTTYLDIAHQIDVLDLCATLHEGGRTLVAVLHDLNLAARYATHIVAMRDGAIVAQGTPEQVVTAALLRDVFELEARVLPDPETGSPLIIPRDRRAGTRGPKPSDSPTTYPSQPIAAHQPA